MAVSYLDFEKPVADLDSRLAELKTLTGDKTLDIGAELERLEAKASRALSDLYARLTPWQKTLVARHPDRPHLRHYVAGLFTDWTPLAGDRAFGDDQAIVGGLARLDGRRVMVLGHEKGDDTKSRIQHNFGMGKPEGYRKAIRLMDLADRFGLPVLSLVDTPGAFPGVQAEERGQAEAIARCTERGLALGVPNVAVIVGEGGSGGAIALAAANRVLMFEHAIYSVISPEGCASILWRTADRASDAADAMGITADRLLARGVIDGIVPEPLGGAQRDPETAIRSLGQAIGSSLAELTGRSADDLRHSRREKFLTLTS